MGWRLRPKGIDQGEGLQDRDPRGHISQARLEEGPGGRGDTGARRHGEGGETLAAVASIRPDLSRQCDSLTGELARFFETPRRKAAQDFGDEEIPY